MELNPKLKLYAFVMIVALLLAIGISFHFNNPWFLLIALSGPFMVMILSEEGEKD